MIRFSSTPNVAFGKDLFMLTPRRQKSAGRSLCGNSVGRDGSVQSYSMTNATLRCVTVSNDEGMMRMGEGAQRLRVSPPRVAPSPLRPFGNSHHLFGRFRRSNSLL